MHYSRLFPIIPAGLLLAAYNYKHAVAVTMASLALAACTTPEPGIEVRTVEVPVPQPCLPADQIPAEPPLIGDQLSGIAVDDLPIVAASALRLRAWGRVLAAAHIACAGGAE